ncbi:bifunctional ATP-dependent DNA helicase/DNA polymerase III subunit epsilon [Enhygromyxa salina]|uniref:Bifunctional ATP-dependent DNA helicase/DNA polymerase III subunit epsilon n=1 Tax=Enhygromyxa salina TaxID=215803 RepID=A0A2S9XET0_9BACT|nr:ATP-dependent DNA helicase [Enhygromyxa salina]PRP91378.1 bifunctional ATP-dependent DNA helicase/DNA polymerase III subunit epsilon [Enhygromyxa salina]
MRYDEERQTLELSVRELAFEARERGLVAPAFARLRTELGRVVHRRVQREFGPGETEVPLELVREIDGVRCRVRGRADLVRRPEPGAESGWVVEEIKSVIGHDADHERPGAQFQVQLYALALIEEAERAGARAERVEARIVLVELETDARQTVEVPLERASVERRLDESLARQLAAARAQAELARTRRASAETVRFPFASFRPGQAELLDAVGEALAQDRPVMLAAPTGTGKTVVSLVPALREGLRREASVWFLTAKTTQRQLAAETFTAVREASGASLRAVVTRRKEDMCPPGHLRCHPTTCPLIAEFSERAGPTLAELADEPLLTPEHLLERGRAAKLCPYELMHARIEQADLVVADYAHVYDPRRSRAFEGPRLVVVDEAHNLVDRARTMTSVFVPGRLPPLERAPSCAAALASLGRELDDVINEHARAAAEDERPAHEGQTTVELDPGTWQELGLRAGVLALRYANERARLGELDPRDPVLEALEAIAHLGELAGDPDPALTAYLAGPEAPRGAGVGVLCLDPGRRLERVHRQLAGVITMSATLEPLDYFADVLGLTRLDPAQLCAASSFPPEHRCVCVVPAVRTTFAERDEHTPAIARSIVEVLRARPGNYAAFFPSFRFLASVAAALGRDALGEVELLIQPPGASEAIRARFLDRLTRAERPTLLLAATGGVFAEGVDLPHDALIGAIVVGPALPALSFERLLMQAHHQARREAGFAYAMAYPGMQRVIQAAGRVHRSPDDRGVIVLLGARFAEPPFCEALPGHWYDHAPAELLTEDLDALGQRLRRFWARAST